MRRRAILVGLAIVAAAIVAIAKAQTRSSSESKGATPTIEELKSGVGRVETLKCDGSPFRVGGHAVAGSGFLIGSRVVMTAEHGMYVGLDEPACKMRVHFGSETYQVTSVRVWSETKKSDSYERLGIDLATLALDRAADGHIFQFAPDGAPRDTNVATLGYPMGGPLKITRGTVTKNLIDRKTPSIAAKIDIMGGNSGGPIINDRGEVVSVVSRIVISGSLTSDGSNRHGGVDIRRWWGDNALSDLCLTYPDGGLPNCVGSSSGTTTKVPIALKR